MHGATIKNVCCRNFVVSVILYKDRKLISASISFFYILNQFSFTASFHSH